MSSFKFVQPENAEELTFSTEFEMVTEVNAEDPTGTVFDELLLKDDSTGQVYKLYIKNGTLES